MSFVAGVALRFSVLSCVLFSLFLRHVSFVAGVASVSGLSICACPFCFHFFFVTCLLWPVLPVYLDCLFVLALSVFYFSSSRVFCGRCCQCIWIVYLCLPFLFSLFLRHVSFVAGVASVSGLSICACPFCFLFFFVTCLLWPVLPVYLDCLFVLALSVFSFSSSRVFCGRCCQCIWIVYLCLPFLFSLFLRHVSFVPGVASVSRLSICACLSIFSFSSSRVFCGRCCQCIWIVYLCLPFLFSLFLRHVSFVPGVASVSGLSICACPFYFLFFFVTCLLFPVLPVYLDCLFVLALSIFSFSSSRVFCGRCCQCIWIVYLCLPFLFSLFLRHVSFVPGVASVSGLSICACPFYFLFFFVTCLLWPVLPVYLDCLFVLALSVFSFSSSRVFCSRCCQCIWIVYLCLPFLFSLFLRHVSFVAGVASVSGLSICACPFYFLFFFVTCLLWPVLPVYLDCLFVLALSVFSFSSSRVLPVYLDCLFVLALSIFSFSSSRVFCGRCCQCIWIVYLCLPFLFSLFLRHVSFVPGVASVSGLSICACPFYFLFFFVTCLLFPVLPVYLDCLFVLALSIFSFSSSRVFCSRCCQCIWIVYLCLPFLFSLFLRHVSFVAGVASVSGLSICACPFYFLFFFVTCLLWPVLPVYLDCLFVLALSVFSFSSSRVFCSRCCQCIWIVYLCLPFLFSLFLRHVSFVAGVASVSGLSICACPFYFLFFFVTCLLWPVLPVYLDCLFVLALSVFSFSSSRVFCARCCQCIWIVYLCLPFLFSLFLRHVSFVPGVASVSGLSICACPFYFLFFFVTCLLWPVLPVYLDCLFVLALSIFSFSSSRVFCGRCCQCIWIVYLCLPFLFSLFLRHVSFVPGVASVSGLSICACPFYFLFFFVTCLLWPVLPVYLDCLFVLALSIFSFSSSRVFCSRCCQCIWIVYLCLPFYFLFFFVTCLLWPVLPVYLDCLFVLALSVFSFSSSRVFCVRCCQCIWIVYLCLSFLFSLFLRHVSFVPGVASVSGLSICACPFCFLFFFVTFSLFLRHVSFVPGVASVSGLSICACPFYFLFFFVTCLLWPVLPVYLDCLFVLALSIFSFSSSRVFCGRCCQCIWIVYLCLPFLFSLFLRHVSFVAGVASVSGLSICACPFCFLFFFVTCRGRCCQCIWIVYLCLPFLFSLFLRHVSFVAGVASVSGLSICACPFCFLFFFVTCLLFPVLPVYLDCLFVLALSVFSFSSSRVFCGRCCQCIWIVYLCLPFLSRVFCARCCQCIWIVYLCLPFLFSLFLRHVSFVPGVASVSGLSICACPFYFLFFFVTCLLWPVLPVYLDCLFVLALSIFSFSSSRVFCGRCCQCIWIVYLCLPFLFSLTFISTNTFR